MVGSRSSSSPAIVTDGSLFLLTVLGLGHPYIHGTSLFYQIIIEFHLSDCGSLCSQIINVIFLLITAGHFLHLLMFNNCVIFHIQIHLHHVSDDGEPSPAPSCFSLQPSRPAGYHSAEVPQMCRKKSSPCINPGIGISAIKTHTLNSSRLVLGWQSREKVMT